MKISNRAHYKDILWLHTQAPFH